MMPLRITAHLHSGFAAADRWSPALDGILAYWHLREVLGPEEFAITSADNAAMRPVEGLPLEVVHHGQWWWYACSSPMYSAAATVIRHIHRRFDARQAERHCDFQCRSEKVQVNAGPYKNRRLLLQQHITGQVQWHAVGDAAEVYRLLAQCPNIGAKFGAGFGRVRRWEVVEGDDTDATLARRHRPLPLEYADAQGVTGPLMEWGIRPPGRCKENRALCVMPT